jgi:tRNA A37 methylthiotransferase MiaB
MFGFPTETKEEFLETIHFLEKNKAEIDLILTSVFGLQASTPVYNNPGMFSITQIHEEKRTILEPKIRYKVSKGLSQEEANTLRRKYKHTIENINKYPKQMNFFREHLLYVD